jgi:hypothetical protein
MDLPQGTEASLDPGWGQREAVHFAAEIGLELVADSESKRVGAEPIH